MSNKPLPSVSLARTEPKKGSAEWLRRCVRNHGDTQPLQLERRRQSLSAYAITINNTLANVQVAKKAFLSDNKKLRAAFEADRNAQRQNIGAAQADQFDRETELRLAEMDQAASQNLLNLEITIASLTADLANIEGHSLNVDCQSIREDRKVKGKMKWGIARYSTASYLQEMGMEIFTIGFMIRRLLKDQVDAKELEEFEKEFSEDVEEEADEEDVVVKEDDK